MSSIQIFKSQLIEVVLPGIAAPGNQTTVIQFPDQPYLRNVPVFGLEVYTNNDMSLSPQNNTPISTAQMKAAYLSLYTTDPQDSNSTGLWLQNIPLATLHRVQNAANDPFTRMPYTLVGQTLSWEKCQIVLPIAYGNTVNVSFLFNIYFKSHK